MEKDNLMNFISVLVIGFALFTVGVVSLSNVLSLADNSNVSGTAIEYPVSKEVEGQTLYFKDEASMIWYFTGR